MAASILIAKLMGPVLLVSAVAMLADARNMQETARAFLQDRPLIYVTGVLAMLGGLAVVNNHDVWVWDWPVLITLFGWAMLIGGGIRTALPAAVRSIGGAMTRYPALIRLSGALWALIGAFLTYKAYL